MSNILISMDGSEVRFIDFDRAFVHPCGRRMPVVLYSYPPTLHEFGCEEIHDLVSFLGVWTPGMISVGVIPRIHSALLLPPKETVECLGEKFSVHRSSTPEKMVKYLKSHEEDAGPDGLMKEARAVLGRYRELYESRFPFSGEPGHPKNRSDGGLDLDEAARSRGIMEPIVLGSERLKLCS